MQWWFTYGGPDISSAKKDDIVQNLTDVGTVGDGDFIFCWILSRRNLAVSTAVETPSDRCCHSNVPPDCDIFAAGHGHESDTDFRKVQFSPRNGGSRLSPAARQRCGSRGCIPRICLQHVNGKCFFRAHRSHARISEQQCWLEIAPGPTSLVRDARNPPNREGPRPAHSHLQELGVQRAAWK